MPDKTSLFILCCPACGKFWAPLPKDNPDPMVAVGKGAQNFPAIVNAAKGNTKWMIIEMDVVATDVYQAIQDSYDYLVKNNFAQVRKLAGSLLL